MRATPAHRAVVARPGIQTRCQRACSPPSSGNSGSGPVQTQCRVGGFRISCPAACRQDAAGARGCGRGARGLPVAQRVRVCGDVCRRGRQPRARPVRPGARLPGLALRASRACIPYPNLLLLRGIPHWRLPVLRLCMCGHLISFWLCADDAPDSVQNTQLDVCG